MNKYLYLINLFLFLFIVSINSQDIPIDNIEGPICVMKDSVTGKTFPLSPKLSQYNVIITDGIAHIDIRQLYVNEYENVNSIVYVFPLPHDGSVHKMEMEYDDMLYKAEIFEKKKAEDIFDSIKDEGGIAALLIQNDPNVFQQRLANIAYNDSAVVRIGVSMPLKYNNGEYELAIPTMVAARYGGAIGTDVVSWNPPENRDGQGLQVNVLVQTGYPITNLHSPSHSFSISQVETIRPELEKRCLLEKDDILEQPFNQSILLAESSTYPNRDYVLRFSRENAEHDFSLATYYDTDKSKGYFALNMFPDTSLFEGSRPDLEIVLLIDISGSQNGWPLVKEKEIANSILDKLLPSDRFTVMSFENSHDWLWGKGEVREANSSNITEARNFINSLNTQGGTELLSAVNAILSTPITTEHERFFVFLTDGQIGNSEAVFARIKEESPIPYIFTFGCGNNLNRYFLDQTAAIANGFSYEIMSTESVNSFVDDAWNKIESPQIKNISMDWGTVTTDNILTPFGTNLYTGRPITVYGTYSSGGNTTVKVNGYKSGQPIELSKTIDFSTDHNTNSMIPQIWARQKIEQLVLEEGPYSTINKTKIINLSTEYQILSKYTAFLAINPEAVDSNSLIEDLDSSFTTAVTNLKNIIKRMKLTIIDGMLQLVFPNSIYAESIEIFDIRGRLVHEMHINNSVKSINWDGINRNGNTIGSGWYIMRIKTKVGIVNHKFHWRK